MTFSAPTAPHTHIGGGNAGRSDNSVLVGSFVASEVDQYTEVKDVTPGVDNTESHVNYPQESTR